MFREHFKRLKFSFIRSNKNELAHYKPMLGPFGLRDMKSIPNDWKVRAPDFVGISSPKAGTSWWYSLILDHPQVQENRLNEKELAYFYHYGLDEINQEAISTYRQAFAAPKGSISGEWSPSYLWFPLALENLFKTVPETKILIMLRNPIDRYLSHLNQASIDSKHRFGDNEEMSYLMETFWAYPDSFLQSCLSTQLKKLLSYYDRSQILLLQYEKCKKNTQKEISRTYKFLGIDDSYQPNEQDKLVNKRKYILEDLNSKQRKTLAQYYMDEVDQTVKMFPEIDVNLWEDFIT
ncbi:MAG: hypothetical protein DHS20C13_06500 [Thermodesulfobacteriota bacterium]|nr:MAG: hypothetical protein DHS20C13_06500 [Thermodesulfobacteriota bacterium]